MENSMNKKQDKHLALILKEAKEIISKKYSKGCEEHSGVLWEVDNLIDEIIKEQADGLTYAITLKHQLKKLKIKTGIIVEDE